MWPGPFGATMMTSMSLCGLIRPKWTDRPWLKTSVFPLVRLGSMSLFVNTGLLHVRQSDKDDVGPPHRLRGVGTTSKPCCSATSRDFEPG